ncbi:MAG: hypothetical protein H6Q61_908 [Firmicutes bacterium]|nr:hypothetical protein [Bacillota bacterium]
MNKRGNNTRIGRWIGVLILAVLCIGGTELLVCRVMEPELYERIVAPVRDGVSAAAEEMQAAGESLVNHLRPEEKVLFAFGPPEEGLYSTDPATWQEDVGQDPAITHILETESGETLTGGSWDVVYYGQLDPQWKDQPYGSDTIGKYGCGPAVMAMVVSTLSVQDLDPSEMALWAANHGYWARKSGSYLSIVQGTAKAYGLAAVPAGELEAEQLLQELSMGKLAVALMGKGHFTDGGHFIVLRGATLGGQVLVADPTSRDRSLIPWDPQTIIDELAGSRSNGAPLWYLFPSTEGL